MKKTILLLSILISFTACNNPDYKEKTQKDTSTIIYSNGDIITMEGNKPEYAEVVVCEEDRIVFVGSKEEALKQYTNAKQYNLKGKTMMPGFIEPHLHPMIAAVILSGDIVAPHDWDVPDGLKKGVEGHDAYIERLKLSIAEKGKEGEVLFIWGYHQLWHGDINKQILSEIAPNIPVVILHRSFHEAYLNEIAIKLFKIKEADFIGNSQVEWNRGHFFEAGWMALAPKISPYLLNKEKYKKGLADMTTLMEKNGITTICEPGFPNVNFDMEFNLLKIEMDKKPNFQVYNILNGTFLTSREGSVEDAEKFMASAATEYGTENIHIRPKQVKLFADGAIYSLAMEMKGGYTDGFEGQWITPPKLFEKQMNYFWDKGYQINIHANGDLGIQLCIDITRRMMERNPRKDHRLTLHHMGYFTDDQADEMKELGMEASANPYYLWALADKYSEHGLGKERAENMVHMKSLEDRGIPFSLHSDFAMAPAEPLTLAWTAINRMTAKHTLVSQNQCIDVFTAMKGITIIAAHTLMLEDEIGSIKVGKLANFTILAENPFKVEKMHIKDIHVEGTVFKGNLKLNKSKEQNLAGGWNEIEVTPQIEKTLDFVLSQMNTSAKLEKIVSVKTQIVKGRNFDIDFRLDNGEVWNVIVYMDLDGSFEITKTAKLKK